MQPVYLSHAIKQFSGSKDPLEELAFEGLSRAYESGARPGLVLLVCAHPLELADIPGDDLAARLARRLASGGHRVRVEFFSNPSIWQSSAHLAASSAGAAVFHEAARRVASGEERSILAMGVEQMRLKGRDPTTQSLRSLIHEEERRYGVTMPALGALLEENLATEFPKLRDALEELMFGNRARAALNPRAHIRKVFRREDARGPKNLPVSLPLRLWDVAPTSSGYAAILLSSRPAGRPVEVQVAGLGQGRDHIAIARRTALHRSSATLEARRGMLGDLGWNPAELRRRVRFAEIHDAFPVIQFLGLMDSGLLDADEVVSTILGGGIGPEGRLPVNLSGGVMGGHPVGATGMGQVVELYLQSTGEAGMEARPPRTGFSLAFNVGGPLTYNFLTLLLAREAGASPELFWLPRRAAFAVADFDIEPPAPVALPAPGRLVAQTQLHVTPPGFDSPLGIGLVDLGGQVRLARLGGGHRTGQHVWLTESRGLAVVSSGPGTAPSRNPGAFPPRLP